MKQVLHGKGEIQHFKTNEVKGSSPPSFILTFYGCHAGLLTCVPHVDQTAAIDRPEEKSAETAVLKAKGALCK